MTTHHDNSVAGTHTIMTDTPETAHDAKPDKTFGHLTEQTKTMNQKVMTGNTSTDSSDSTSKAMAIPLASSSPTGFLDLSPELRNEIYMLCLQSDEVISIYLKMGPKPSWFHVIHTQTIIPKQSRPRPFFPSLLATCSLIHAEATPVLYGSHRFSSTQFGNALKGGRSFFDAVGHLACHNIRHVEVIDAQTGQLPHLLAALGQCDRLESLVLGRWIHDRRKTEKSWVSQLLPMVKAWQDSRQGADAETILKPLKLWHGADHYTQLREAITAKLMAVLVERQKDLV
ncbi:hypothetical protein TI39_contig516g00006 [Zymoseptoria brevis]|uniref:2EXR domain-containing protein n=1 Tax=Zymoseptoria brevis TaxID=1047168 RepID=A0A0F4GIR5_9PEZI|nr:hypothetical protein TI39_contig516g00006 [Zymoseptoria brevis]